MKKLTILMLVGIMVLTNVAYGIEAKDVEEDNWAYSYVKKVVDTDLMPLYDTDKFETGHLSTKMEVINVIYRMALLKEETTVDQVDAYLDDYQEIINGLLIPQSLEPYGADNHRAIAYALKRNIVRTSELSLFFTNGRFEPIKKVDASVYMAKALNVYLEQNVNKFYEILFKDNGEIAAMAGPYVNLLVEQDIVSSEGDNGYFYPNSTLSRNVLSVLTTRVLRSLEGYEKEGQTTDETSTGSTFSLTGRLSIIHYDKNIIEVRDAYENKKIYDVTDATFTVNDVEVGLENLESGMEVSLKTVGNRLVSLSVVEEYKTFESTLSDVGSLLTIKDETYRVVFFDKTSSIAYLKALKSVVVTRDYQKSSLEDVQIGDKVIVSYENGYVKKIDSFSKKVVLDGVLQRASDFNKGDVVGIELSNGYIFEETLKNSVQKINMSKSLLKGDVVKVTLANGAISVIENTGLTTEATGRLVEIKISDSPSVSLINQNGVNQTYNLSKTVKVENLGVADKSGVYALRLDQDITVHLKGVLVNEIEINKAVERTEFESTITEIFYSNNLIKAKDLEGKEWIISLEGSNQKIGDYKVNDKVYVYGVELSSDLFEADLVIVLD